MAAHYAVRVGRVPGIYSDWSACSAQVTGFAGAQFKKFASREAARAFLAGANFPSRQAAAKPKYRRPVPEPADTALPGLTIYTDGSCSDNGSVKARAGAGVYFGPDDPRNLAEPVPLALYPQSSNAGELYAAVLALRTVNGYAEQINLVTDSNYVVEGMRSWVGKWKINGKWDKPSLPNTRLWHELDALEKAQVHRVRFLWVKGHANCTGNAAADALADKGRRKHLD
jgi:ribonuclease HI